MGYEGLILDRKAGVATLTLNRPQQLNAISIPMVRSIEKALDEIERDDTVKALIITGAGRGFCAGLDVGALSDLAIISPEELGDLMRALTLSLYNISKPTIAAINGVAVGAGLSLALLCDIRIGSEKAWLSSGYFKMGLTPDIGSTYTLPRLVGTARAMELMVTGETFDAAEACRAGLLNKVVPEEELTRTAGEMADKIAAGPSLAVKLTREAIRKGTHNSLVQQIELECAAFYACLRTQDHQEGLNAFREKRPPEFEGK